MRQVYKWGLFVMQNYKYLLGLSLLLACQPVQTEQAIMPTPFPSSTYFPTPSPSPSPVYSYTPTEFDASQIELNSVFGSVYDQNYRGLHGATIRLKSLNELIPFDKEFIALAEGKFKIDSVPAGIPIEITVSKPGYATRKRVVVVRGTGYPPDLNNYNFGSPPPRVRIGANPEDVVEQRRTNIFALSALPEITRMTPNRNQKNVSTETNFTFDFSEPVIKHSFESNIQIRAFSSEILSVTQPTQQLTLMGSESTDNLTGTPIFSANDFSFSWNAEQTQVQLSLKPGLRLPSDQDHENVPTYQVVLHAKDGILRDLAGNDQAADHFKLVINGRFEPSVKFQVHPDTIAPKLTEAKLIGQTIHLQFSEPMILRTRSLAIAGGLNGNAAHAPAGHGSVTPQAAAANYSISVQRNGQPVPELQNVSWASLGGEALFTGDPHIVILKDLSANTLQAGDKITLKIANTVLDPAGNPLAKISELIEVAIP